MNQPDKPAQLDYLNEREIVLFMRFLLDFHDLLLHGWDKEMANLRKKLHAVGWGENMVIEFLQQACEHTRYEELIPSMKYGTREN